MKFNKILPPYKFKEYWSKYPLGQSIYQAILDWAEMFNELITDHNVMSDQWDGFQSQIDAKANTVHTHVKADITDFAHTHPISEVTDLQTALNGKANTVHTHPISEVTDLQTALNGKANTTTTVNSKALSTNITINASDVPNTPAGNIAATNVQNAINELDTEKANRTQEAWITPTLLNGWTATSGFSIGYMKDTLGFVHIRGAVTGGNVGLSILQLPVGYRPPQTTSFATTANGLFGRLMIDIGGNLFLLTGSNTNVYLDCIIYMGV